MAIPLDEFLNQTTSPLSEDELNQQLFNAFDTPNPAPAAPTNHEAAAGNLQSLMDSAFDQITEAETKRESVDTAVKAASHGVKVLAPLLVAGSRWLDPNTESDKFTKMMGEALTKLRHDTKLVIEAFGLTEAEAPSWLTAQVSGQIMEVLVHALERNNGSVLKLDDTRYIAPLLALAKQAPDIGINAFSYSTQAETILVSTLMVATSQVMAEYQNFNYFHENASEIAQTINNFLNDRVIDGTLAELSDRWGLTDQERGYMGASLLKQAGNLLASAWADNILPTLDEVKELPKEARRELLTSGYPLDRIKEDFEQRYQGLEISAIGALRALSPSREQSLHQPSMTGPRNG